MSKVQLVQPDVVFYHANCPDGFGAAWSYWRAHRHLQKTNPHFRHHTLEMHPIGHHQHDLPSVEGKNVVMVDVVLDNSVAMNRLVSEAKTFRLLDHHQSAYAQYHGESWAHFDLSKSGAVLAWEDSHPNQELPLLLKCIQERDLEKRLDSNTEAILQVADSTTRSFYDWELLHQNLAQNLDLVLQNGHLMRDRVYAAIERLTQNAIPISMRGRQGWAINAPVEFGIMVINKLLERPDTDFGFSWYVDAKGDVRASWRSHTMDVIELANRYGGGGHPYSAGAIMSLQDVQAIFATPTKRAKPGL